MTNKQLLTIFENNITKAPFNNSEKTKNDYVKYIGYLLDYLEYKNIEDITSKDIKTFFSMKNISDSTYNVYLSAFRTLYKVLNYNEIISSNPTNNLMAVKSVKHKEKTPLSLEEQMILLQYAKNRRTHAVLQTLLSTGMRINECFCITISQYENRDKYNGILLTDTKRDKDRMIYLNQETIDAIEEYLPMRKRGCDKLFVSDRGNKMDSSNFSKTIKNVARKSKEFDAERIKGLCNHLMRATCASTMLNEKGIDIDVVQEVLAHSSIQTTRIYAKTDVSRVRMAMVG